MTTGELLRQYEFRLREIRRTVTNIERAYAAGSLVRRDLDKVYKGLLLEAVVGLERCLEEVLVGLVCGAVTHPRPAIPVQVFRNRQAASQIVNRGRYEDFLPIDRLERLSKVYFRSGANPMLGCPAAVKQEVDKALCVRNYIAHQSKFSERKWRDEVVQPTILPPRNRDLLGYFRFGHSATVTKFEYHCGELLKCAGYFCT